MIALKIIKKMQYNTYVLQEKNTKREYQHSLEFYDGVTAEVGDYLILNESLLNSKYQGYCNPYAFAKATNNVVDIENNPDIAVLHKRDINILLKRLYG